MHCSRKIGCTSRTKSTVSEDWPRAPGTAATAAAATAHTIQRSITIRNLTGKPDNRGVFEVASIVDAADEEGRGCIRVKLSAYIRRPLTTCLLLSSWLIAEYFSDAANNEIYLLADRLRSLNISVDSVAAYLKSAVPF